MVVGIKKNFVFPPVPSKKYFSIAEVSSLCGVKPHVLRYWESEFSQISPSKRKGNRRYYQLKDIMIIRHIRLLLYEKGYTINGAREILREKKHTFKNSLSIESEVSDKHISEFDDNASFKKIKDLEVGLIKNELKTILKILDSNSVIKKKIL